MYQWDYASPVGNLILCSEDGALIRLERGTETERRDQCPILCRTVQELDEYFNGLRQNFDIPLRPGGTVFQREAWAALCRIPYGETWSYGKQAAAMGRPKAVRAVGQANHRNPICILIPCHRVIGAKGALIGYGGGLDMKAWLLALEARGMTQKNETAPRS